MAGASEAVGGRSDGVGLDSLTSFSSREVLFYAPFCLLFPDLEAGAGSVSTPSTNRHVGNFAGGSRWTWAMPPQRRWPCGAFFLPL